MTDTGVVITGMGLVTPLGLDLAATWAAMCAGRSGIGPLTALEQPPRDDRGGGQAPPCPANAALPREARYLRRAIQAAMLDAGTHDDTYPPERRGVMLGTTLHGMSAAGRYFRRGDPALFRDFPAPAVLQLAVSGLSVRGGAATTCSACSSGLGSIALGVTLLQASELDLVIAGGYDPISEYSYAGFNSLRLIADGPVRPFCHNRTGMKVSEGYGIVVLERLDDARRRGATIRAAILGFGESSDAHHLTQPQPDGEGIARAIRAAMAAAELDPNQIGMICAHATGTLDNDGAEHAGMVAALGPHLRQIPCAAMKSQIGHTLGGAGAVELILAIEAMHAGRVPPTLNVSGDALAFDDLRVGGHVTAAAPPRTSMNLSLGFGGANTCMLTGMTPAPATTRLEPRDVVITGVGIVLPGAIGNAAMAALLADPSPPTLAADTGAITDNELLHLIDSRRVRRMSEYVKLTLAAVSLACDDADIVDRRVFAGGCSAILGTCHGSANYSTAFYEQIVREGLDAANPLLFAEGVPNAAAAHLSLMLGVKGPCQTILGSRTSGLDALRLAALRIRLGHCSSAIVSAGEEFCTLVRDAYRQCGMSLPCGSGAVALVLESADAARSRGARPRAALHACAAASFNPDDVHAGVESACAALSRVGPCDRVLTSGPGTWVDRVEAAAIDRTGSRAEAALQDRVAETFSVMPLAAIAAALLDGRDATGTTGVCCTDSHGLFAVARLTVEDRR